MCLTRVDKLFILQVLLERLDHLDSVFDVVGRVLEDNFTDLLPLVRTLTNKRAVRAEQMLEEELVKVVLRAVVVLVDPVDEHLGEQHCVGEGAVYGAEAAEEDQQEGEESGAFGGGVVEGVEEEAVLFDVVFKLFDEVEGEPIAHLVDLVEERVDHVVLDLEFVELGAVFGVLGHELGDFVVKYVSDRFLAATAQLVV